MSDEGPQDPLMGLAEAAVTIHQIYREYCRAGFTCEQAFEFVKTVLAASVKPAS